MELSEFARRILNSESLALKLRPLENPASDDLPGAAWRPEQPCREERLKFAPRRAAPAMPSPASFSDPRKRGVAHHIMANHELQALEVMAFVLTAFPDAPREFRFGLADIMQDEQRHTRMHVERASALGITFGELPVNCYIWKKAQSYESLLDYLAGLPLTFETRNLDHTIEFESAFLAAGDRRSAAVMRRIHEDEIEHVRFGLQWLRRLKPPDQTDWEAYASHLHWPMRPEKSVGNSFQLEARRRAGLDEPFLSELREFAPGQSD
jgi:uncharacterized ferritin-like protein (DUF455 family)